MNKAIVGIGAGILVVGFLIVGIVAMSLMGMHNGWVAQEKGITAQYSQNQNNYDTMFKKVVETAQVPNEYASKLKELYDGTMTGRYGKEGSKAMMQMITESNPQLDAGMYVKVQQIIESSRESFSADQKTLLDKKRVYETDLEQFPGVVVAKFMGFPRIDLAKYDIVTSEETQKAFETKKAAPLQVFGK